MASLHLIIVNKNKFRPMISILIKYKRDAEKLFLLGMK